MIFALLFVVTFGFGQTAYNPFTQNIHFAPEPTPAGFACGSTQTVAFTMGLTTAANATDFINNPLTVTISVTGFRLVGTASSIVSGSYASNFDWAFDSFDPNGTIIGTQKQTLIGTGSNPVFPDTFASGEILLSIYVPETSPISTVLAVNVNLQVPGYMQQFNSTPDDNESSQTQTYCCPYPDAGVVQKPICVDQLDSIQIGTPAMAVGNVYSWSPSASLSSDTIAQPMASPATTTTYTVTVTTPNGCVQTDTVTVFAVNCATVLPVTLKQFIVTEYNCIGLLSWTTSQELNTSYVEILRKDPQGSLRTIDTMKLAGTNSVEKTYTYLDKKVSPDNIYEYQLKFVDVDGQFTTSDIKTLKLDCTKENTSINVFPNPATSQLNILYATEANQAEFTVEVVDIAGRTLLKKTQFMGNGSNIITFDVSTLVSGTYFLKINSESISKTFKFSKN